MVSTTGSVEGEPPFELDESLPGNKRKRRRNRNNNAKKDRKKTATRDLEFETTISNIPVLSSTNVFAKLKKLDLFPEISKKVNEKQLSMVEESGTDVNQQAGKQLSVIGPRDPTEEETTTARKYIQDNFITRSHGHVKVFNSKTSEIISMVEFLQIPHLESQQKEDFEFVCEFIHSCKQFIIPHYGTCNTIDDQNGFDNVTSMIGWSQDTTQLVILEKYLNKEAIEEHSQTYQELKISSTKAAKILWDFYTTFANVACENTRKEMIDNASLTTASTSLSFPMSTDVDTEERINDLLPLTFAMIIPIIKSTGKIASEVDSLDIPQLVFPDLNLTFTLQPNTVPILILRDRQYSHRLINSSSSSSTAGLGADDFSRLAICIRPPLPSQLLTN
ncbi:hypothetical protein Pst134EA_009716 [Puccinia striiformis f. sp. tritici]|uniref:hypothetical protein n=1 Tax=Puccinia striiformis f. sp. tritici TaxID=168172 RepID=UPI002008C374|nr:hypothetical protein Pst134EA_009716 [Puccinia striiformis f. sp. tritici]KAH9469187.1 hypothetical protein Pst134EA_009716 [Puccinia striiformis f. sp. tritici]KAI9612013.1 hypothetical protein H4Q26_008103 [Puccinia striiformis f. sp. tritici PST-130]